MAPSPCWTNWPAPTPCFYRASPPGPYLKGWSLSVGSVPGRILPILYGYSGVGSGTSRYPPASHTQTTLTSHYCEQRCPNHGSTPPQPTNTLVPDPNQTHLTCSRTRSVGLVPEGWGSIMGSWKGKLAILKRQQTHFWSFVWKPDSCGRQLWSPWATSESAMTCALWCCFLLLGTKGSLQIMLGCMHWGPLAGGIISTSCLLSTWPGPVTLVQCSSSRVSNHSN